MPDRLIRPLKPDLRLPATTATEPISTSASAAYVTAASSFPAKIWPRSSERVRIVFSVPL